MQYIFHPEGKSSTSTDIIPVLPPKRRINKIDIDIKCGDVFEKEFAQQAEEHEYYINMSPGDAINVSAEPVGDFLHLSMDIYEPGGNRIYDSNAYTAPIITPQISRPKTKSISPPTKVLSGRGTYRILLYNYRGRAELGSISPGSLGAYSIFVGCRLRDGTVIQPKTQNVLRPMLRVEPTILPPGTTRPRKF